MKVSRYYVISSGQGPVLIAARASAVTCVTPLFQGPSRRISAGAGGKARRRKCNLQV